MLGKITMFFIIGAITGFPVFGKTICINNDCSVSSEYKGLLNKKFERDRALKRKPSSKEEAPLDKIKKSFRNTVTKRGKKGTSELVLNNAFEGGYVDRSMPLIQEVNLILNHNSLNIIEGQPALISGTIIDGSLKGARVIGVAELNAGSMTISLKAKKIQFRNKAYSLEGVILDGDGVQHISASVSYNDTEALLASSSTIALGAIADSSIDRERNSQGETTASPTVKNALTKGAIGGLMNASRTYLKRLEKGVASATLDPNQVFKLVVNSRLKVIN